MSNYITYTKLLDFGTAAGKGVPARMRKYNAGIYRGSDNEIYLFDGQNKPYKLTEQPSGTAVWDEQLGVFLMEK